MKKSNLAQIIALFLLILLTTIACGGKNSANNGETETPSLPTATEHPMAARINGEGILFADYEEELKRYKAAVEQSGDMFDAETGQQVVLDFLIEQTLLTQKAFQDGFVLTDDDYQKQMSEFVGARGGQDGLSSYLAENFYTEESFQRAISRDMAVIWMRNNLVSQAPTTAEQVHARQILVNTENDAIAILRQLEVGTSFKDLAFIYDPLTGGDLGWFPRGYLFQPAVEEAAFSLQEGQFSGVIATDYGFHIVEVIEVDPQHPLSQDALVVAQNEFLRNWLDAQKAQSTIEIYIN